MARDKKAPPRRELLDLPVDALPPSGTMAFSKTPLGLWVPRDLATSSGPADLAEIDETPAILQFSITTVCWSDITGQMPTLQDVTERIGRYSLRQAMSIVARITLILSEGTVEAKGKGNLEKQFQIASLLLGREGAQALIDMVKRGEDPEFDPDGFALFHERQALNALKLAFLAVDVGAPDSPRGNLVGFVEALLMLNDLIEPIEGAMGPAAPGGREAMELYLSANMIFNENPTLLRDFVRAHYLYIEQRPEITTPGVVDVPAALARATGMDAETVWRALFALFCSWAGRDSSDLAAGRVGTSRSDYLSTLPGLPEEDREQWFRLATWEAGELQDRIRRDYSLDDPRYWDVLPFEERPLVAFGDLVFCSSLVLFRRLPGGSLQHRLQDREVFNATETRQFRDTRGYLVERYTLDTLERAFGDRFIPESKLKEFAGGRSVCDGVIVYPDALLMIECKTASPLLDTRHAKNYEAYRDQWSRTMRKAATQVQSTISLLREGAFAPLGLEPTTLWELFPIVAVFEQAVHPSAYRAIREVDLAGHSLSLEMASGQVRPLQLLHIKEVELLEIAVEQGQSVLALFQEKTSTPETTELSFHHFIHTRGEVFQHEHSRWQKARFAAISKAARSYFRKTGPSRKPRQRRRIGR